MFLVHSEHIPQFVETPTMFPRVIPIVIPLLLFSDIFSISYGILPYERTTAHVVPTTSASMFVLKRCSPRVGQAVSYIEGWEKSPCYSYDPI